MHLFIIPGNPPALHFYELWAEEIKKEYKASSVYISPYPFLPNREDSLDYLNQVAAIHRENLVTFQKKAQAQVTVIGHSLGGWMALRLLENHPDLIENCLLLYPFLRRPSLKGRIVLRSMRQIVRLSFLKEALLKHRKKLERVFDELPYVTDQELRTSLLLIDHEYTVIGRYSGPLEIPQHLSNKLHMLYCDRDKWCPTPTIRALQTSISSEKTEARHGFITSKEERAIVLKTLFSKIGIPC